MSIRSEAEENLRVIRSMMEKAKVYRALSSPGALLGGTCSVSVAAVGWWFARPQYSSIPEHYHFAVPWLTVLTITVLANFWLLRKDAGRRAEPFVSPGMRHGLSAMLPAILGGAVCFFLKTDGGWPLIASFWVLFYGISLLAASHFAPKSICWLGRAFFVAGMIALLSGIFLFDSWRNMNQTAVAHVIMGLTFGLLHILYGLFTWPEPVKP